LFIPSVFVWGSGIFKDTICIFGLDGLYMVCFAFLCKKILVWPMSYCPY
jgi:hypothetical protein